VELSELPREVVEGLRLVCRNLDDVGKGIPISSLKQAVRRYIESPGKMVRPLLSLATAYSVDQNSVFDRRVLAVATSIELVHLVSLIQDDIVDGHIFRRGVKTPFAEYGVEVAVLASDYLIAQAVKYAVETGSPRVVKYLAYVAERLSIGQAIDVELKRLDSMDLNAYMESILDKTASLMEASLVSPLLVLGVENALDPARRLGRSMGALYQLIDDIFDARGLLHGHDLTEREVPPWLRVEDVEKLVFEWIREGSEALDALCASLQRCDAIRRIFESLLRRYYRVDTGDFYASSPFNSRDRMP